MTNQYVYILSNELYPQDFLKIGWTRSHPSLRAQNLQTSGIPSPFRKIWRTKEIPFAWMGRSKSHYLPYMMRLQKYNEHYNNHLLDISSTVIITVQETIFMGSLYPVQKSISWNGGCVNFSFYTYNNTLFIMIQLLGIVSSLFCNVFQYIYYVFLSISATFVYAF